MNTHTLFLQPTDVLFFRDGRPLSGSFVGHTAAWPLPDVTNHALLAAFHRAGLDGVHEHRRGRSGQYSDQRDRRFGSVQTAGPFPVDGSRRWFFPRPKDTQVKESVEVTLLPLNTDGGGREDRWPDSSLPQPLHYAVANTRPPEKESAGEPWISQEAFGAYLERKPPPAPGTTQARHFLRDEDIADQEANLGIAIDPATQTTGHGATEGMIYTAHYLRLRDGFGLGMFAEAMDKAPGQTHQKRDLLRLLFNGHPTQIIVGGQQRTCTAVLEQLKPLPLPKGLAAGSEFAPLPHGGRAVKWILLSPAVWPEIPPTKKDGSPQNPHPGGWLPNWVCPTDGSVLLTSGPGLRKAERIKTGSGAPIRARLIAAIVPKPIVVTGWALPNDTDRSQGGAKSAHLAVPAGAVYYFEADSPEDAGRLAEALNWHGAVTGDPAKDFITVKNRRSTLLGEKGFGIGVCGTWEWYGNVRRRPTP
jgi:CRISPR/Cas system CMR-associated protein Cmr3 (group 5 of RAMP superfamily)